MILQKQKKIKTRKRKKMTVQYDKLDVFTNCVKTYQKTLNCQILEPFFFNDGIKNLPTDCTVTKKTIKRNQDKVSTETKSKFALVPFFLSWRGISKSTCDYQHLSKMFTYILYCPNIAKCPWLLQIIPMNISRSKLTSLKMP
jgi:hypothetical protein